MLRVGELVIVRGMPTLKTYFAVMLGGALGTGLRLWLGEWVAARCGTTFPWGTILVNVTGCFAIGLFAALTAREGFLPLGLTTRQVVMVGILGGYTTFSSFSLQTLHLLSAGDVWRACGNVVLSVVLCLLAVWLGHLLATVLNPR